MKDTKQYQQALFTILSQGVSLMQDAVKANVSGSKHEYASGISIYFPEFIIHKSYHHNSFAQQTHWLEFLKEYVAH